MSFRERLLMFKRCEEAKCEPCVLGKKIINTVAPQLRSPPLPVSPPPMVSCVQPVQVQSLPKVKPVLTQSPIVSCTLPALATNVITSIVSMSNIIASVSSDEASNYSGINSKLDDLASTLMKEHTRFGFGAGAESNALGNYTNALKAIGLKFKLPPEETEDLIFGKAQIYTGRDKIKLKIGGQEVSLQRGSTLKIDLMKKAMEELPSVDRKRIIRYWQGGDIEKRSLFPPNARISNPVISMLLNMQPLMISAAGNMKYLEKDKFRFHVPIGKGTLGDLGFFIPAAQALMGASYPASKSVFENELNRMFQSQQEYISIVKDTVFSKAGKTGKVPNLNVIPDVTMDGLQFADKSFGLYFSPLSYPLYSMSFDTPEAHQKAVEMMRDVVHEVRHAEQWLWTLYYCQKFVKPCFYLDDPEAGKKDLFLQTRNDVRDVQSYRKTNRTLLTNWVPTMEFMDGSTDDLQLSKKLWERYDVGGTLLTEPKPISLPMSFSLSWPSSIESKVKLRKFYDIYWKLQFCHGQALEVDETQLLNELRINNLIGNGDGQASEGEWNALINYEKTFYGYMNKIECEREAFETEEKFENKMRVLFGLPLLINCKEIRRFSGHI